MLKANRFLKNGFMIIRLKHFHDILNIAVILVPGCEFYFENH